MNQTSLSHPPDHLSQCGPVNASSLSNLNLGRWLTPRQLKKYRELRTRQLWRTELGPKPGVYLLGPAQEVPDQLIGYQRIAQFLAA